MRNNVESVFLPAGTTGNFTFTVNATNIAGQADATLVGNNQDFALVVYNGNTAVVPSLSGNTGALVPNDCNTLTIPISNVGATNLSAVLACSTGGVTITQPNSAYPDLVAGATGTNATAFRVSTAASVPCGTVANFTLTITYTGGGSPTVIPFNLMVGADTTNYAFTVPSGASLPAGGVLVQGSNSFGSTLSVATPFPVRFYGITVSANTLVIVSTSGNMQVTSTGTGSPDNRPCPPACSTPRPR